MGYDFAKFVKAHDGKMPPENYEHTCKILEAQLAERGEKFLAAKTEAEFYKAELNAAQKNYGSLFKEMRVSIEMNQEEAKLLQNNHAAVCKENARLVAENKRLRDSLTKHGGAIESIISEAEDNLRELKMISEKIEGESFKEYFIKHTKSIQSLMKKFKLLP